LTPDIMKHEILRGAYSKVSNQHHQVYPSGLKFQSFIPLWEIWAKEEAHMHE